MWLFYPAILIDAECMCYETVVISKIHSFSWDELLRFAGAALRRQRVLGVTILFRVYLRTRRVTVQVQSYLHNITL